MVRRKMKKGRRKRGRRNRGKITMINKMPRNLGTIVAPRFFTNMTYSFQGQLGTTATQSQQFGICASLISNPGNVGQIGVFDALTGGTLVNNSAVGLNSLDYAGASNLRGIYNFARIHNTKLTVTFTPNTAADALEFAVLPVPFNPAIAAYNIPTTWYEAKTNPRSKSRQCTGFNDVKGNTLIIRAKNRDVLGMTKEQYRTSLPQQASQDPAGLVLENNIVAWFVQYSKYTTGTFSSPCNVYIKMQAYVEWSQPQPDFGVV